MKDRLNRIETDLKDLVTTLDGMRRTIKAVMTEVTALKRQDKVNRKAIDKLTELAKDRRKAARLEGKPGLTRIEGWNVQLSTRDGLFRAFKRIRGRQYSCYIGKELNSEEATRKIKAREVKIMADLEKASAGQDQK